MNPYINFNGNTEDAFNFYKSVFGGEFAFVQRFKDVKDQPGLSNVPEQDMNKIMHIALPIGKTSMLMATDVLTSMGQPEVSGNNISIALSPESKAEADKIFGGLSAGGQVIVPMSDMFWGAYFGMFIDKFGIQWMLNFDPKVNG
jgi:PhnB protein